jgi:hypothetical protein
VIEKTSKVAYAVFRKEQGQWVHVTHQIGERTDPQFNKYARRFVGPFISNRAYRVDILPVMRVS